ncbi:MAG: glycine--tRNA ligase subunit beta [Paracoccaceae bacterium]|nr:glycine--tRNA ligase subunit beta [Paracoccaceae bacterium]
MPELLLEVLSEEIPARMQRRAARDLEQRVSDALSAAGLEFTESVAYATPRRLCLRVAGLSAASGATREERRGPRADAPEAAVEGFLRSTGLERENLEVREDRKGKGGRKAEPVKVLYAVVEKPGRAASDIAADVIPGVFESFPWPKSMRWGARPFRWVRPIHSILCILSEDVDDGQGDTDGHVREAGPEPGAAEAEPPLARIVPFEWAGIRSGDRTRGHRYMSPESFSVACFRDYRGRLAEAKVILDSVDRAERVRTNTENLVSELGLELIEDSELLAEIAGLVEWPVVLVGHIPREFLGLPPEVLQVSMREHQKFLSVRNPGTGRIEAFVTVANTETADGGATILAGNRKVLSARLSDAAFFWDNDMRTARTGMKPWRDGLASVTFHNRLGSQADRANRLERLAGSLSERVGAQPEAAESAARIAKLDLLSEMVQEFPELQGRMGRRYAVAAGYEPEVADACREHHLPAGANDPVPHAPVSVAVGLADRFDMLFGFWSIGEKPTGSKDPFALRRAAIGIIRLILENQLRLPLHDLFAAASSDYPDLDANDLIEFFHDRLKVFLRGAGIAHEVIDACLAMPSSDDLWLLVERARSLQDFLGTAEGTDLLQGFRRANNILVAEERKDGVSYQLAPDMHLVELDTERALFSALGASESAIVKALDVEDFVQAMTAMSRLRVPVDAFFDAVLVNSPNPVLRRNRLCLLNRIREVMCRVADFSKIGG